MKKEARCLSGFFFFENYHTEYLNRLPLIEKCDQ